MTDYSALLAKYSAEDFARTTLHSHRQPYDTALLNILEDGQVSVTIETTWTGNDGTPMDVWHGRTLEFSVNGNPDLGELATLLGEGGKASELIDRIVAGHDVEWDGHNMVGRLTDDARDAKEALSELLECVSQSDLSAWEAGDWLLSSLTWAGVLGYAGLTVNATDEQVEEAVDRLVSEARTDKAVLDRDDVAAVLRECIEHVRQDLEEEEAA